MSLFASLFGSWRAREIIVTDVTRMQGDRLCVAGLAGKDTVRLAEPSPTTEMSASLGEIELGQVLRVEVNPLRRYRPPHCEDCRWIPISLQKIACLGPDELHDRLAPGAVPSLGRAFGRVKYFASRGNPAYPPDRGKRSLATIRAHDIRIYRHEGGMRADFGDSEDAWHMLPVEGIAIRHHCEHCRRCLDAGHLCIPKALLRVGLGRPFRPDRGDLGCFAQVNSIVTGNADIHADRGAPA